MHENVIVCAAAEQAKARATEIEKRADDLRRGLDRAYTELVAANNDLAESRSVHAHEMADARQAWERERISMAQQATALHGELSKAREEAAELRGALAAIGPPGQKTRVANQGARQRDGGGPVPRSIGHGAAVVQPSMASGVAGLTACAWSRIRWR
nr:hypothetical protein [uncultured Duganella sp.]